MEKFRYSALDTAHRCLQRYKRQYIDQEKVEGAESADPTFGTGMHAGLQAYLEGDDGLQTFKAFWDTYEHVPLLYSRLDWKGLQECGLKLLTRFERLHLKRFEPYKVEAHMEGVVGGHAVEGTVDYLGKYEGVPVVLDFKTSNYAYPKEKLIVNSQMPLYAELAVQNFKYEVEERIYYVFCKLGGNIQVLRAPLTSQERAAHMAEVAMMCDELKGRTRFPKNPNNCMMGTFRCPYYTACHGGKNE